jgi:hypothetical protein
MSLAQTALLASAIRPRSSSTPAAKPSGIVESISQRPLQWLVVAGVVVYFGSKALGKLVKTGEERKQEDAETSTSQDNPFSYNLFLTQKNIPKTAKLLTAAGAYKFAKEVYEALNFYFDENEDVAIGVFKVLPTKLQVAQVAQSFYNYYKIDILNYIKNGNEKNKFRGGLSEDDYKQVITIVSKKSKF